jgi:hypothetical protein
VSGRLAFARLVYWSGTRGTRRDPEDTSMTAPSSGDAPHTLATQQPQHDTEHDTEGDEAPAAGHGQVVNLATAAALLGRTESTIRRWAKRGELHPTDTGQRQGQGSIRLFDVAELRAVNARHGSREWHSERLAAPASGDMGLLWAEVHWLALEVAGLRTLVEALRDELAQFTGTKR